MQLCVTVTWQQYGPQLLSKSYPQLASPHIGLVKQSSHGCRKSASASLGTHMPSCHCSFSGLLSQGTKDGARNLSTIRV